MSRPSDYIGKSLGSYRLADKWHCRPPRDQIRHTPLSTDFHIYDNKRLDGEERLGSNEKKMMTMMIVALSPTSCVFPGETILKLEDTRNEDDDDDYDSNGDAGDDNDVNTGPLHKPAMLRSCVKLAIR